MAEILFAAWNLPDAVNPKYGKGDPIVVKPNGWVWGTSEGPNEPPAVGGRFAVLQITDCSVEKVANFMERLIYPATIADDSFGAPDVEDRIVQRWRRQVRLAWNEVPIAKRDNLFNDGWATTTLDAVRPFARKLTWNGVAVELSSDEAITPGPT